jgi:hypothetical protein
MMHMLESSVAASSIRHSAVAVAQLGAHGENAMRLEAQPMDFAQKLGAL